MNKYFEQVVVLLILNLAILQPKFAVAIDVEEIYSDFLFPSKIAITPMGMTVLLPLGTSEKSKVVYISTADNLNNPASFSRTATHPEGTHEEFVLQKRFVVHDQFPVVTASKIPVNAIIYQQSGEIDIGENLYQQLGFKEGPLTFSEREKTFCIGQKPKTSATKFEARTTVINMLSSYCAAKVGHPTQALYSLFSIANAQIFPVCREYFALQCGGTVDYSNGRPIMKECGGQPLQIMDLDADGNIELIVRALSDYCPDPHHYGPHDFTIVEIVNGEPKIIRSISDGPFVHDDGEG